MADYGVEFRNLACGECGEVLIREGEMTGVGFAIPADASDPSDILCEPCATTAGVWEEPGDDD
jgi:hypothetical protein